MRLAVTVSIIACILVLGMAGQFAVCAQPPAMPVADTGPTALQQASQFVAQPWVTAILVVLGMALLVIEIMTAGLWGAVGVGSVICLGAVIYSHVITGAAAWDGVALIPAGTVLLLVAAHLLPGHAIIVLAGIGCVSLGTFWALGGSSETMLVTVPLSIFVAAMTFAAFLVYLPRSPKWRAVAGMPIMSVGRLRTGTLRSSSARQGVIGCEHPQVRRQNVSNQDEDQSQQVTGHD